MRSWHSPAGVGRGEGASSRWQCGQPTVGQWEHMAPGGRKGLQNRLVPRRWDVPEGLEEARALQRRGWRELLLLWPQELGLLPWSVGWRGGPACFAGSSVLSCADRRAVWL